MTKLPRFAGIGDVEAVERQPIETYMVGSTLPEVLANAAAEYTERPAYRFYDAADLISVAQTHSYADIHRNVRAAAALFRSLGIGRSDVVATLLPGLPQTIEIVLAGAEAGIIMPINPFLEPGTIAAMLQRVSAGVLCIEGPAGGDGTFAKLEAIRALAPCLEHILIVGEKGAVEGGTHYEAGRDGFLDADHSGAPLPAASDIAGYFHTGGTTGAPKIAPLTHFNLAAMSFIAAFGGGIRLGDAMPCGMPLFHVGGLVMGAMAPLAYGATIIQLTRRGYREPGLLDAFWGIVSRERAAILVGPPTVVIEATQRFRGDLDLSSVRSWISSAAALPAEVHRRFTAMTGIPIKEAWGLTEATLVLTFTPPDGFSKPGAVGVRLPYSEVEIAALSPEGEILDWMPRGEPGVIVGRSPCVFPGYLDPAANDGVLLAGDWLNTGDIGLIDPDGYVVITGRAKDMINRGGHNIDPKAIEDALMTHPDVSLAAAVGRPDARVGEIPIAFVAVRPGTSPDPAALLKDAASRIDERAAIPKQVIVLPALPLTGVGKVHKPTLRHEAARLAVAEALDLPPNSLRAGDGTGGRTRIAITSDIDVDIYNRLPATLDSLGLDFDDTTSSKESANE
jgi:fatty-acyl-CoA synthase